jgi:hypothetical protein
MRYPTENDDARPRVTPNGEQLSEVRVRRNKNAISTRCRLHDSEISGAEKLEITDMDSFVTRLGKALRDAPRKRLVDQEPH